jgi:hypothetical protein
MSEEKKKAEAIVEMFKTIECAKLHVKKLIEKLEEISLRYTYDLSKPSLIAEITIEKAVLTELNKM